MTRLSSTREALLAEAIGELGALLDRVEAVGATLQAAGDAAAAASDRMAAQAVEADRRIGALIQGTKAHTAKHIAAQAALAMQEAREVEVTNMTTAAQALFQVELASALRRAAQAQVRRDRSWLTRVRMLWTHLAAGGIASLATWACMLP